MLIVIEPDPLITSPAVVEVRVALPNVTLLPPVTNTAWGPELRATLLAIVLPPLTAVMAPPRVTRVPRAPARLVMAAAVTTLLLPRFRVPEVRSVLPV